MSKGILSFSIKDLNPNVGSPPKNIFNLKKKKKKIFG